MTNCCGPFTKLLALGAVILIAASIGLWWIRAEERHADSENQSTQSVASLIGSGTDDSEPVSESSGEPQEDVTVDTPTVAATAPNTPRVDEVKAPEDTRMTSEIVGKWKTVREAGPREIVIRDDGTATMDVEINTFALKLLFGKKMRLDIKWHIAGGLLYMETVGGEPAEKVELLKSTYGESLAYPILELSKDRLLVQDGEGDPDHDWERFKD